MDLKQDGNADKDYEHHHHHYHHHHRHPKFRKHLREESKECRDYNEERLQSRLPLPDSSNQHQSSKAPSTSITSIVANHYNGIENNKIEERKKCRIYHMRNFNNWIKSIIIGDTITLLRKESRNPNNAFIVHDLGCGKGGDLIKYEKNNITHLIGSDIAEVSIEHCKERFDNNSRKHFTAEFINVDCTRQLIRPLLSNPDIEVDMTSSQFSFHYCFESLEQVKMMVKNASDCLKVGGIFCGTIPDSIEVMKRLKQCGTNHFGNDVYSIRFEKTYDELVADKIPLFGSQYDFHLEGVVDCPEFLVYFPVLEEICSSYGMKLIFKKRFDEFYQENKEPEENYRLLNFMEALEKYPPGNNESTSGKPADYKHIRQYMLSEHAKPFKTIGTLSQPEWEAVTLYLVFSFRKIF